jgi:glutathione S-transferase
MAITLFDLAGADPALRFSPYCWRTRMALAHKGLETNTVPWRFTEERIAFSGSERVPVIVDKDRAIADSWNIAEYLEDTYPDHPSLFAGPGGRAHARFNAWADQVMNPGIVRLLVLDIWGKLDPRDQPYFCASREAPFRRPLQEVVAGREARVASWREALARHASFFPPSLGSAAAARATPTTIVFGGLQWAGRVSRFELLAPDDPLVEWRGWMLALFGGLAGAAVTV